jgi:hypothetical protein
MERSATIGMMRKTLKRKREIEQNIVLGIFGDDAEDDMLLEYAILEDCSRELINAAKAVDRETLRRSYRYVPRSCLFLPVDSAFKHLFSSANPNNSALSALIRMSRATFDRIMLSANPLVCARLDGFTSPRRNRRSLGRAYVLDAAGHLGLALTWMATTMHDTPLGILFGLTNLSKPLRLGKLLLFDALKRISLTACRANPDQLLASYAALEATASYGPCPIPGIFPVGTMDCVVQFVFNHGDVITQNSFYSGKNGEPGANNLTVGDFLGKTIFASLNWRGKRADSSLMTKSGVLAWLRSVLPPGGFIIADDAFGLDGYYDIIWAGGRFNVGVVPGPWSPETIEAFYYYCLKIRKSIEWNNHSYVSLWPRLRELLPASDTEERGMRIELAVRLTNLVASFEENHVQTKTVFQEGFLRGAYGQRVF